MVASTTSSRIVAMASPRTTVMTSSDGCLDLLGDGYLVVGGHILTVKRIRMPYLLISILRYSAVRFGFEGDCVHDLFNNGSTIRTYAPSTHSAMATSAAATNREEEAEKAKHGSAPLHP
uniref:Uncharacterized protein n=1 Tax=Arundo donax TaxID=35708 RepID=A0A0A9A6M3_ARUDO